MQRACPVMFTTDTVRRWFLMPRVQENWVRVLEPNGVLYAEVRESELDGVLEGWTEEPLLYFRDWQWDDWLVKHTNTPTLHEVVCSGRLN
jgi:hypothetical protein